MSRRPALSICLYLEGRRVLLVGDSPAARERGERLRDAGADIIAIGPEAFEPARCRGVFAVFACTDDRAEDRRIAGIARAEGCLTYAQDVPGASDLAMPALVRRGPLQIAISTDATAPALSRRVREELERSFEDAGEALDALLAEMKARRAALKPGQPRGHLYEIAKRLGFDGRWVVKSDQSGD